MYVTKKNYHNLYYGILFPQITRRVKRQPGPVLQTDRVPAIHTGQGGGRQVCGRGSRELSVRAECDHRSDMSVYNYLFLIFKHILYIHAVFSCFRLKALNTWRSAIFQVSTAFWRLFPGKKETRFWPRYTHIELLLMYVSK